MLRQVRVEENLPALEDLSRAVLFDPIADVPVTSGEVPGGCLRPPLHSQVPLSFPPLDDRDGKTRVHYGKTGKNTKSLSQKTSDLVIDLLGGLHVVVDARTIFKTQDVMFHINMYYCKNIPRAKKRVLFIDSFVVVKENEQPFTASCVGSWVLLL